jgi:hypothetical protein
MAGLVTRLAAIRGLLSGSRGWLAFGTVATAFRVVRKIVRKEPKVVYREDLAPGETLVITHLTHHVG